MATGKPWSEKEVRACVQDYFDMLEKEQKGLALNKSAHRRALKEKLDGRSDGSIEMKHANVSAVLRDLGYEHIKGYQPYGSYQKSLRAEVCRVMGIQDTE